jgi:membrane protease YdiL (CAAX protease family)
MMEIEPHSFGRKILSFLFLLILFLFLGQIISAILLYAYYGADALDFKKILSNKHDNFNIIRLIQIFVSIFSFALPAIIYSRAYDYTSFSYAFAKQKSHILLWILVPLLIITFYPFLNFTYILNKQSFLGSLMLEQQAQYKLFVEALLSPKSILYLVFNFMMVALVPAIVEEWIFRGTLQKLLSEKLNIHLAVLASAIIFSLIHFEFSGFLPRMFLGILLGYIFYFSGNIWLCIWMHLFNNGMEVVLMYIKNIQQVGKELYEEPTMPTNVELFGYSFLFIIILSVFYKIAKQDKKTIFAP